MPRQINIRKTAISAIGKPLSGMVAVWYDENGIAHVIDENKQEIDQSSALPIVTNATLKADYEIFKLYQNTDTKKVVYFDGLNINELLRTVQYEELLTVDFEDGLMPAFFNIVNDTNNDWLVMPVANIGLSGNTSNYCIGVSNNGGASGAYSQNDVCHIWFDLAVPTGISAWRMSALWCGIAESVYDYIYITKVPNTYIPTAGVNVPTTAAYTRVGNERYNEQTIWTRSEINFGNEDAGNTVRFVISFRSDGSVQNAPAGAFDDFKIEVLR